MASDEKVADFIQRSTQVPTFMEGALSGFGGYLRCRNCGLQADLGDPGRRVMGQGWPKCCGYTMEWITQGQIDRGERPARRPPKWRRPSTPVEEDGDG